MLKKLVLDVANIKNSPTNMVKLSLKETRFIMLEIPNIINISLKSTLLHFIMMKMQELGIDCLLKIIKQKAAILFSIRNLEKEIHGITDLNLLV
jgi:hypothetical protein